MTDPHEQAKDIARRTFPKMPEEVIEQWFAPTIRHYGWPPLTTKWIGVLRLKSLDYWAALDWDLREVTVDKENLTPEAREIVGSLMDWLVPPYRLNRFVRTDGGRDSTASKFNRLLKYAREHGAIPQPLILIEDAGRVEIADGCHRLAMILGGPLLSPPVDLGEKHPAWVGALPPH